MSNENQDRSQVEWSQVTLHKDDESGALIVIKKSNHRRPAVEFAIGSAHGKTGLFTPHNLVKYDNEKPISPDLMQKFVDGLARIVPAAMESLKVTLEQIQKTIPKQRNNGNGRKPGEPGKTGKTARKKAAKMDNKAAPAAAAQ